MNEPEVRLHDVSVSGADDQATMVAAIRDAVAAAVAAGTPTKEAVQSAVTTAVARRRCT